MGFLYRAFYIGNDLMSQEQMQVSRNLFMNNVFELRVHCSYNSEKKILCFMVPHVASHERTRLSVLYNLNHSHCLNLLILIQHEPVLVSISFIQVHLTFHLKKIYLTHSTFFLIRMKYASVTRSLFPFLSISSH